MTARTCVKYVKQKLAAKDGKLERPVEDMVPR
jgi:hypothetical protein